MAEDQERINPQYEQNQGAGQLTPLGRLDDFEVAEDFPDPRGWDVVLADGNKVGEVKELIVDTEALRTRYLAVKLDREAAGLSEEREVLIPVGAARLDDNGDNVILDSMELRQLSALPVYNNDELTRDYEQSVVGGFGSSDNTTEWDTKEENFYANRSFDDKKFYGSRWNRFESAGDESNRGEAGVTGSGRDFSVGKRSSIRDAANDMTDGDGLDKRTGKAVAGGAGGVAGATGGAAIGSVAGPIGTVIGAIAGAAGGWWAGKNVAEKVSDFESEDEYFNSRFTETGATRGDFTYERARPGYQLGFLASQNPDYSGRSFEDIEPELQGGWNDDLRSQYGEWNDVRGFAADAFSRRRNAFQEDEVQIQSTIETEHGTKEAMPRGRPQSDPDEGRPRR